MNKSQNGMSSRKESSSIDALLLKPWLFANTKTGAQASAALYSLVETAKINGLEPYDYLCRLLTELPKANTHERLQQLLPY